MPGMEGKTIDRQASLTVDNYESVVRGEDIEEIALSELNILGENKVKGASKVSLNG